MKNKIIVTANILLVVTALAMGYGIYRQQSASLPPGTTAQTAKSAPPRSPEPGSQPPPSDIATLDLTPDEEAVLSFPWQGAPDEEKQRHFEIAQRIAQSAPYLDITRCAVAKPVVFQVKQGAEFTLRNDDIAEHTIILSPDKQFNIPAGGTKKVVAGFGQGPGLYGYGCDSTPHPAGVFLVVP